MRKKTSDEQSESLLIMTLSQIMDALRQKKRAKILEFNKLQLNIREKNKTILELKKRAIKLRNLFKRKIFLSYTKPTGVLSEELIAQLVEKNEALKSELEKEIRANNIIGLYINEVSNEGKRTNNHSNRVTH